SLNSTNFAAIARSSRSRCAEDVLLAEDQVPPLTGTDRHLRGVRPCSDSPATMPPHGGGIRVAVHVQVVPSGVVGDAPAGLGPRALRAAVPVEECELFAWHEAHPHDRGAGIMASCSKECLPPSGSPGTR